MSSAKRRKTTRRSRVQNAPGPVVQPMSVREPAPAALQGFSGRRGTTPVRTVPSLDYVKSELKRITTISGVIIVLIVVLSIIVT